MKLRAVIGSFLLLGRRARELGQPGLTIYTDTGLAAVKDLGAEVVTKAHQVEISTLSWAERIKAMVADRKITPAELAELEKAPAALLACADRSHDITEAMRIPAAPVALFFAPEHRGFPDATIGRAPGVASGLTANNRAGGRT